MICENARVYTAEGEMIRTASELELTSTPLLVPPPHSTAAATGNVSVVVVLGHTGSTSLEVATALLPRLPVGSNHVVVDCSDLTMYPLPSDCSTGMMYLRTLAIDIGNRIRAAATTQGYSCLLLSLIVSPAMVADLPLLLDHCMARASSLANGSVDFAIKFVISTVASYQLAIPPAATDLSGDGIMVTEEEHFHNKR